MYCSKCGKPNVDDAQFCVGCGQALTTSAPQQLPPSPPPVQAIPVTVAPAKRHWYFSGWFIVPALFGCFPVGIALMWIGKTWNLPARIIVTVILPFLIILGMVADKNNTGATYTPSPSSSVPSARSPEPRSPDLEITAGQLFKDYHANEVSADARYKGKAIAVTGKIAEITKDFAGNMIVNLATPSMFQNVMAKLDHSQADAAGRLTKGQSVRLICEGTGMVIGMPSLDECFIR